MADGYQLIRVMYKVGLTCDEFYEALICRTCMGNGCAKCQHTGDSLDNGYTYMAPDDIEFEIGDIVRVPPTKVKDYEQDATVIGLGSNFKMKSRLKWIIGLA